MVGLMYEHGEGVSPCDETAPLHYYEKASRAGNEDANDKAAYMREFIEIIHELDEAIRKCGVAADDDDGVFI